MLNISTSNTFCLTAKKGIAMNDIRPPTEMWKVFFCREAPFMDTFELHIFIKTASTITEYTKASLLPKHLANLMVTVYHLMSINPI